LQAQFHIAAAEGIGAPAAIGYGQRRPRRPAFQFVAAEIRLQGERQLRRLHRAQAIEAHGANGRGQAEVEPAGFGLPHARRIEIEQGEPRRIVFQQKKTPGRSQRHQAIELRGATARKGET